MYLLYNEMGEVELIYQNEPSSEIKKKYHGCIKFTKPAEIEGYITRYNVDIINQKVIVSHEYQTNLLREEIENIKGQSSKNNMELMGLIMGLQTL